MSEYGTEEPLSPEPDWGEVGFASAHFDDARPLLFLYNAILERASVCVRDDLSSPYLRRLPEITIFRTMPRAEMLCLMKRAILCLAEFAINPYYDYTHQNYALFPVFYTAKDIEESEHPLGLMPPPGSTETLYIQTYRRFLEDCLFWLRRFRLFQAPYIAYRNQLIVEYDADTENYKWTKKYETEEDIVETEIDQEEAFFNACALQAENMRIKQYDDDFIREEKKGISGECCTDVVIGNWHMKSARALLIARYVGGLYENGLARVYDREGSDGEGREESVGWMDYSHGDYFYHPYSLERTDKLATGETILEDAGETQEVDSEGIVSRYPVFKWTEYNEDRSENVSGEYVGGQLSDYRENNPLGFWPYSRLVVTTYDKELKGLIEPGVLATASIPGQSSGIVFSPTTSAPLPDFPNLEEIGPPPSDLGKHPDVVEDHSKLIGPFQFFPVLDFGDSFTVTGEPLPSPFN